MMTDEILKQIELKNKLIELKENPTFKYLLNLFAQRIENEKEKLIVVEKEKIEYWQGHIIGLREFSNCIEYLIELGNQAEEQLQEEQQNAEQNQK